MSEFVRTEAEIYNMKRVIDLMEFVGSFKDKNRKERFELRLKREGFPSLTYFKELNDTSGDSFGCPN